MTGPQALMVADAVLVLHVIFVVFVVGGLIAILAGGVAHWRWVRLRWLRLAHLAAIAVVVAQSWGGVTCPLTTLESRLRAAAGSTGYRSSFIQHWLHEILFYAAPTWVFTAAYTAFGLLVLLSWVLVPPR